MPTVLLLRHGRTSANASGLLAGWTPGVGLDDVGAKQAAAVGERLAAVNLAAIVCSPLQRCQETAAAVTTVLGPQDTKRPSPVTDSRLGEVHYGDWTGRPLKELSQDPLWPVVQNHPSAVRFPGEEGEHMLSMQTRAIEAIREHDDAVRAEHGDHAIWLAVSHGDVIKAILADALGMHFDAFQRIVVDTASLSAVRYTRMRPFVVRMNQADADLSALVTTPPANADGSQSDVQEESSDAVVGGQTGAPATE